MNYNENKGGAMKTERGGERERREREKERGMKTKKETTAARKKE